MTTFSLVDKISFSVFPRQENPEFIRITSAGLRESHPHDVIIR